MGFHLKSVSLLILVVKISVYVKSSNVFTNVVSAIIFHCGMIVLTLLYITMCSTVSTAG